MLLFIFNSIGLCCVSLLFIWPHFSLASPRSTTHMATVVWADLRVDTQYRLAFQPPSAQPGPHNCLQVVCAFIMCQIFFLIFFKSILVTFQCNSHDTAITALILHSTKLFKATLSVLNMATQDADLNSNVSDCSYYSFIIL